jgi:hypothetical protein
MAFTRAELTKRLAVLDAAIPRLRADHPEDADFWNAFSSETDFATECAGSSDYDWVNAAIDDLLRKHGEDVRTDEPPVDG